MHRIPRVIYTDKLRAYLEGIERVFGADTRHAQGGPFDVVDNTNLIERFHSTLKERTKVMRGLHTMKSARRFLDGWLVHYNFFRPHMSLRDMTPAMVAGIKFPFHNWKDICEQPFELTARIPIRDYEPVPDGGSSTDVRKSVVKRKKVIKRKAGSREKTPTSLAQMRVK